MNGVADSSPLHHLVQIRAENVLPQLFVELITPPEAIAELTHPRARAGTSVATRRGIRTTGTVVILAMAAKRNLISLPDAFAALRATSFRAPESLMNDLLELDRDRGGQHG